MNENKLYEQVKITQVGQTDVDNRHSTRNTNLTNADVNPVKHRLNLIIIQKASSYLTENTARLHYKNEPVLCKISRCLFGQSHETQLV